MKNDDFTKMKKQELVKIAGKKKIKLTTKMTKDQMISAILSNRKQKILPVKKLKISMKQGNYSSLSVIENDNKINKLSENQRSSSITLLVRDPWWVYAYWEISPEDNKKYELDKITVNKSGKSIPGENKKLEMNTMIVRVYHAILNTHFDIPVHPKYRGWYFQIPEPNKSYYSEIGILNKNGKFTPIARSNLVMVPPDKPAIPYEEMTEPQKAIFDRSRGAGLMNRAGQAVLNEWTNESNAESSQALSSSGLLSENNISSFSENRKKDMFLVVNTELIIYGSVEKGMNLMMGGKPIKIGNDGRFSARFYINDGNFSIPLIIENPDNNDNYEINTIITKQTIKTDTRK